MTRGRLARSAVWGWIVWSALAVAGCERAAPSPVGGVIEGAVGTEVPAIDRPVVDRVGLLSAEEIERLSAHLLLLRERTGVQMAVLLVATTDGEPIDDYSMRAAEAWRGGAADRDDGLLLTMAMNDRRMRLEVGYGLEELVTDGEAQLVVDGMREDLRAGDPGAAIGGAIEAVARELPRTHGSVLDGGLLARPAAGVWAGAPFAGLALVCLLGFVIARRKKRPSRRAWAGLAGALVVISAALAWLYADLAGPVTDEPFAFLASAAVLFAVGSPLDRRTERLPHAVARWVTFGVVMALVTLAIMGLAGAYLGSMDALSLSAIAFAGGLVLLPFMTGAPSDRRGSSSRSSYSSSSNSSWSSSSSSYSSSSASSSSSSPSSSSSYSGGGGGFGGGGASSSW
ncbi:MAG: TPM domain-containing protein [Myxococcota bacterium]|nr:TPM domain-containing protein [Myxococcota bacterium]